MAKIKFGVFAPILGEKKDFPSILLEKTVQTDNRNIVRTYGEVHRRKMRKADMLSGADEFLLSTGWTTGVCPGGCWTGSFVTGWKHQHYNIYPLSQSKPAVNTTEYTITYTVTGRNGGHFDILFGGKTYSNLEVSGVIYLTSINTNNLTIVPSVTFDGTIVISIKKSSELKVKTPDTFPILHYHRFVKRSTAAQYILAFTKAHIYHWNATTQAWDTKFTCSANCTEWDTVNYNDKVIATNNVDKVLVWDTTGSFVALDDPVNGIECSRAYSNETSVDVTSAIGQKVLSVTATTGYVAADKVIIGRGTVREEEAVVNTVQAGVSLTLISNLTYAHTANAKTTVDADSAAGQKVLNVASTTNYAADEYVSINIDGDRWEVRKIDTIQAGVSLTFTVNLSYTHTAVQGDEVVGTAGTNDKVEEYTSTYLTKAKYVTTFENYLEVGFTYENGVSYPQRIRWNDIGDETKWRTGDAGSKETEGEDSMMGFKIFAGQLVIFKEKSRSKQWLISTSEVWNWVVLPGDIGCLSNHSIVEDPDGRVYWLASDMTFREMDAGEISHNIDPIVKLIEPSSSHLVQGVFIEETGEVWWSIPYSNALNNKVITYKEGSWGELDLSVPAFGSYKEA